MTLSRTGRIALAFAAALVAVPAIAQFSDSYTFLKAVRDRDGAKAQSLIATPGSPVVNTRDQSSGDTALHILTRGRDLPWLNLILSRGGRADVQNRAGETPLGIAAQIGWAEGAEALIRRGAGVNFANGRGETPLILAVQRRDAAMVRLLMASGANPALTDNVTGYSALDYARQDQRGQALLRFLEETPAQPVRREAQGPGL